MNDECQSHLIMWLYQQRKVKCELDTNHELFHINHGNQSVNATQWQSTPALLPGKSHGRRSLIGYSPRGRKESDTTEQLHFHFLSLSRYFVFFFSWKVKHLLAQKAKNIDSPYREEAPGVLVWPPQSSGNHFTFWGERWGTQGWDKPTSESSTAGHPALQLLLALAKYAFSWAGLPSAAYLWHHHPCVTENYWKLRQQGKAD